MTLESSGAARMCSVLTTEHLGHTIFNQETHTLFHIIFVSSVVSESILNIFNYITIVTSIISLSDKKMCCYDKFNKC